MKIIIIILVTIIFFAFSCTNVKEKNDSSKNNIVYSYNDWNYIKTVFIESDSFALQDADYKKIGNYQVIRANKTFNKLDTNFVKKFVCDFSNTCFGKSKEIYYIPHCYLKYSNYVILVIEKYRHNFPIFINDFIAISFDTINCEEKDKIKIYQNPTFQPDDDEINFIISKNEILLTYFERKTFSPATEEEKFLQKFVITKEGFAIDVNGTFIKKLSESKECVYDTKKFEWIK